MPPYADISLKETIRENQSAAEEDDYRIGLIEDYLSNQEEVCVLELWKYALGMSEFSKPSKKDSNEIAIIMQNFDEWGKQTNPKRFKQFGLQKWWKRCGVSALEDMSPL